MKIYIFSIVFIFLFGLNSLAQKDFSDLLSLEDSIKSYSKMIYNENKDSSKLALNLKLLSFFQKALNNQASFYFPFDSLKHITKLTSPDNKLRFYIWAIELSDKSFNYFGFLQYYNKNEKKFIYSGLLDNARNSEKLELAILNPDNWYGTLYYKILINKHRKKIYYTLLGWDGNNYMSRKKIIDVLYFNDDNKPCFGEPIFVMDKETKYRVIFEYSAEAVMLLVSYTHL
ncbi:MAG: hypothetical protein KA792_09005, partial [Bacteroidales bacterium]|nr:hypothetical protein [Bacteroidales bacterium]